MRFRKAMNVSFVLIPIVVFMIGVPVFRFTYTAKDINNMKKVLQEAAYAGALAGTYAMDINSFQNGTEVGRPTTINTYPNDKDTGTPVSFMKQVSKSIRTKSSGSGVQITNPNDCLNGSTSGTNTPKTNDIAAKEIIQTVNSYIDSNLSSAISGSNDYSIAMEFSREGLAEKDSGRPIADDGGAPYNKVVVSVVYNYQPRMLNGLKFWFGKNIEDSIPIYGTSSAKTKTIM